jgi:beta-lactamase superfamily II metal-dependent hydrolase
LDSKSYSEWFTSPKKLEDPLCGFISKHKKKTTAWEDWAKYVGRVADAPEMELAAALESSVNGTSLVLLFKFGRATLLFPGDAQWGTWNAMLADDRWQRLFKNLSFYKVGHHGCENATPRRFVGEYILKVRGQ